ncbi:MAG: hypothetical protein JRI94_17490 [Deltaproteobacteria bacterium]|nr:hypothetical protein [Deltaproteobacteria bacterium]MBW2116814.1 hypothetical protein [Deltaproteobacteria bacterium]
MSEKLFGTIKLENNLDLEIWDLSRVIAGDRWLVSMEARLNVPIEIEHLETLPDKEKVLAILKETFGEGISYRYNHENFFVDKNQKREVFQENLERLKENVLLYLSRPDFAKKLVLSKYRELKTKKPHLFPES